MDRQSSGENAHINKMLIFCPQSICLKKCKPRDILKSFIPIRGENGIGVKVGPYGYLKNLPSHVRLGRLCLM